jgi:hypothetical protein
MKIESGFITRQFHLQPVSYVEMSSRLLNLINHTLILKEIHRSFACVYFRRERSGFTRGAGITVRDSFEVAWKGGYLTGMINNER